MNRKAFAAAFPVTLPVLFGFIPLGIAFGLLMDAAGYPLLLSLLLSLLVYAGSAQFMGVELLAGASPLGDAAFLTLIINFRHLVYGLSMLEKFRGMGARKLYMIFSLTDETYALLSSAKAPEGVDEHDFFFAVALLDQSYWVLGSVIGSLLGSALGFDTTGVDFAMTALFLVIAVEQWQSSERHAPVFLGAEGRRQSYPRAAGGSGHSGQPAAGGGGGHAPARPGHHCHCPDPAPAPAGGQT